MIILCIWAHMLAVFCFFFIDLISILQHWALLLASKANQLVQGSLCPVAYLWLWSTEDTRGDLSCLQDLSCPQEEEWCLGISFPCSLPDELPPKFTVPIRWPSPFLCVPVTPLFQCPFKPWNKENSKLLPAPGDFSVPYWIPKSCPWIWKYSLYLTLLNSPNETNLKSPKTLNIGVPQTTSNFPNSSKINN